MKLLFIFSFIFYFFWLGVGIIISLGVDWHELNNGYNKYFSIDDLSMQSIFFTVVLNNLKIIFFITVGGCLTLGLLTLGILLLNGFLSGVIIGKAIKNHQIIFILLLALPHGMFELPAIWFAGAAGLKGPQVFIRYLRGGQFVTKQDVKEFLILSLASIILIIIAGIIEATVTYEIAKNLMK